MTSDVMFSDKFQMSDVFGEKSDVDLVAIFVFDIPLILGRK